MKLRIFEDLGLVDTRDLEVPLDASESQAVGTLWDLAEVMGISPEHVEMGDDSEKDMSEGLGVKNLQGLEKAMEISLELVQMVGLSGELHISEDLVGKVQELAEVMGISLDYVQMKNLLGGVGVCQDLERGALVVGLDIFGEKWGMQEPLEAGVGTFADFVVKILDQQEVVDKFGDFVLENLEEVSGTSQDFVLPENFEEVVGF